MLDKLEIGYNESTIIQMNLNEKLNIMAQVEKVIQMQQIGRTGKMD